MAIRLLLLYFLLFTGVANAATYYVDYATGADSNNGTATGTPFKHSPGDTQATSTAASTTLSADDTVIFKGGVSYVVGATDNQCFIELNWSGSDGSPITYDGNSAGSWGTGKAIITSNNDANGSCGARRAFSTDTARSWLVIQNFEMKDIGGYASLPSATSCSPSQSSGISGGGIHIYGVGGGNHIIQDNLFHELGTWEPQDPFEDGAMIGGGIGIRNQSNVTIDSNEFTKVDTAIAVYTQASQTTSGITISNNLIHNYIRWGIDIPPQGTNATFQNIDIFGNSFYDYAEYDQGNWAGCGGWPHTDGIFLRSDYSGATWTNIDVYSNDFYDTGSTGGGTASIYVTEGPSVDIYNNTFHDVLHASNIRINNTVGWGFSGQAVRVYNNSFYGDNSFIDVDGTTVDEGTVSIKNNAFHHTGTDGTQSAPIFLSSGTVADHDNAIDELDYNQYYSPNSSEHFLKKGGSTYWTFANIQGCTTITGCTDWETNGNSGDPKYTTVTASYDFTLQSDSPSKDDGVSLSSYFTTDKAGITRPIGSGWDIGAYEYSAYPPVTLGSGPALTATGSGVTLVVN